MANTYTQIHIHVVFAVKSRQHLLSSSLMRELHLYMIAIIQKHGHRVLAIGGMADHVHILIGLRPSHALADLMREVKASSAHWINSGGHFPGRFEWQDGYGAFSYDRQAVPTVITYIRNQQTHHRIKTFAEEYRNLLDESGIEYDERYVFK
jgi:REP element-mobilizing transposase RayT